MRLQRYLQSNLNNGVEPVVYLDSLFDWNNLWLPDLAKVKILTFEQHLLQLYRVPAWTDYLNLKKVFYENHCSLVHAHDPFSAYYSHVLGLPTIFDDWEHWINNSKYIDISSSCKSFLSLLPVALANSRCGGVVKHLLKEVPTIVTNCNAQLDYERFSDNVVAVVPNVPLLFEREHTLKGTVEKPSVTTTSYVGCLAKDNWALRDTSGIVRLWHDKELGKLNILGGEHFLPHLEMLRELLGSHFNLLYWKPMADHKFYLQNKAFLASVLGISTIISSSLTATIDLLGDYALPVDSLSDIPRVLETADRTPLAFNPRHVWEFYESQIYQTYKEVSR